MNFLPRALCVFLVAATAVNAQRIEDPELDDYVPRVEDDLVIYVPKNSVRVGFRSLSGVNTGFSGQGIIASDHALGAASGTEPRVYHDGFVGPDLRTVQDPGGVAVPIAPDGYTNNWGFGEAAQATSDGLIAMHAYTATVTDTSVHQKDPGSAFGVEVTSEREMGNLFGTRIKWGLVAGIGMNQILATTKQEVAADVTTVTDYYSLDGQAAPEAPYTAPVTSVGVDTSVLLRNELLLRQTAITATQAAVENRWKLRGGYLTFRGGPSLLVPFGSKFSFSISTGAVLVYAGTSYEVEQTFTPETGEELTETLLSSDYALLPGYYVDANLQYDFTETAGLYLGAVYQSSGSYDHEVENSDGTSNYKARVNLSSLQGFRAGVSFKF